MAVDDERKENGVGRVHGEQVRSGRRTRRTQVMELEQLPDHILWVLSGGEAREVG